MANESESFPRRIIVTGGLGFIGSNFIHHIIRKFTQYKGTTSGPDSEVYSSSEINGLEILNIDKVTYAGNFENVSGITNFAGYRFEKADIADIDEMRRIFSLFKPECVVHFAAESHVDRSIDSGNQFIISNVLGTQVLLEAARSEGWALFIHVSTDEVYGSTNDGSFSETSNLNPSSPYSSSKASSDLVALSHFHTYGTPVIVTRCTNNFGPRQHPEKLVPKVITNAMNNQPIPVYGSGKQVRDWLYVSDHCEAIVTLISKGEPGEVYNIAAQNELTNLEIIESLTDIVGDKAHLIEHVNDRLGHDFRYSVDDSKIRNLGWSPLVEFKEGVHRTVEWYSR